MGEKSGRRVAPLLKSLVHQHTRTLKSGKVVLVRGYSDKRTRRPAQYTAKTLTTQGNVVYEYDEEHAAESSAQKFGRVAVLAHRLPEIIGDTDRALDKPDTPLEKVVAAVIALMDRCQFRIGTEKMAEEHGTFGVTTLRTEHVTVSGDEIRFTFSGKKQVAWDRAIVDPRLARLVTTLKTESPDGRLFWYHEPTGESKPLKATQVNTVLNGYGVTAKDFRTYHGTRLAWEELRHFSRKASAPVLLPKEIKLRIAQTVSAVAEKLGNTAAVAKGSYILPQLLNDFAANGGRLSTTNPWRTAERMSKSVFVEEGRGRITLTQSDRDFAAYLECLDQGEHIEKSLVKPKTQLRAGKVVQVRGYSDKRTKKQAPFSAIGESLASAKSLGKEVAAVPDLPVKRVTWMVDRPGRQPLSAEVAIAVAGVGMANGAVLVLLEGDTDHCFTVYPAYAARKLAVRWHDLMHLQPGESITLPDGTEARRESSEGVAGKVAQQLSKLAYLREHSAQHGFVAGEMDAHGAEQLRAVADGLAHRPMKKSIVKPKVQIRAGKPVQVRGYSDKRTRKPEEIAVGHPIRAPRTQAAPKDTGERIVSVPIAAIRPDPEQHRKTFNAAHLRELADSMKESGQKTPIVLRPVTDGGKVKYQIIAGERRWRAAHLVGLKSLKATVREGVTQEQALQEQVIENLNREQVTPMEEAVAYGQLAKLFIARAKKSKQWQGKSADKIAEAARQYVAKSTGKSQHHVAFYLKLNELEDEVQEMVSHGSLTPRHGNMLTRLTDGVDDPKEMKERRAHQVRMARYARAHSIAADALGAMMTSYLGKRQQGTMFGDEEAVTGGEKGEQRREAKAKIDKIVAAVADAIAETFSEGKQEFRASALSGGELVANLQRIRGAMKTLDQVVAIMEEEVAKRDVQEATKRRVSSEGDAGPSGYGTSLFAQASMFKSIVERMTKAIVGEGHPHALFLLRHGEAGPHAGLADDPTRPLTEKGKRQAQRAAQWFKGQPGIAAVFASPLTRTQETAKPVAAALGLKLQTDDALVPGKLTVGTIRRLVGNVKGQGSIVVVSHEPDLSSLTKQLTGEEEKFSRGEVRQVQWNDLRAGRGSVVGAVKNREMKAVPMRKALLVTRGKFNLRELIAALRTRLAREEETIGAYEADAARSPKPQVAAQLQSIADEERVHVGELTRLLIGLAKKEKRLLEDGKAEVEGDVKKRRVVLARKAA
jgi:DNA topoisomerase-1